MKTISPTKFRIYLVILVALSSLSYGFWSLITGEVTIHPTDEISSFLQNLGFLMIAGFIYFIRTPIPRGV
jgi:hypothetical protein